MCRSNTKRYCCKNARGNNEEKQVNLYTLIKTALNNIGSDADLYVYDNARKEAETLNLTDVSIIINPDFRVNSRLSNSMEIIETYVYEIDFLDLDEWDNTETNDPQTSDESTFEIIDRMRVLANSVLWAIFNNEENYFPESNRAWSFRALRRVNSNTMSGVRLNLSISSTSDIKCNY